MKIDFFRKRNAKPVERPDASGYKSFLFTNQDERYRKYKIGDYTYGFPTIYDLTEFDDIATKPTGLQIGKFCSIGPNVSIFMGSEHRVDWVTTYPFNALNDEFRHIKGHPLTRGDIDIGNDVWIGANVSIMSGVHIGDGAVIGANSLVLRNVDDYAICTGVPGKEIRKRFDAETILFLQKAKWWDRDIETIRKIVPLLQSDNFEGLRAALAEMSS